MKNNMNIEGPFMVNKNPDDVSPLTETTLYILVSLVGGPLHGYAIGKRVRNLSEDRIILSVSTLYTTLKRMLEDGWIERVGLGQEADETGRPRKTYALTERGRSILEAEKQRLQSLLALVKKQTAEKGI
jgi:PadR family transcriptional regulator PadR